MSGASSPAFGSRTDTAARHPAQHIRSCGREPSRSSCSACRNPVISPDSMSAMTCSWPGQGLAAMATSAGSASPLRPRPTAGPRRGRGRRAVAARASLALQETRGSQTSRSRSSSGDVPIGQAVSEAASVERDRGAQSGQLPEAEFGGVQGGGCHATTCVGPRGRGRRRCADGLRLEVEAVGVVVVVVGCHGGFLACGARGSGAVGAVHSRTLT